MSPIERAARGLCELERRDADLGLRLVRHRKDQRLVATRPDVFDVRPETFGDLFDEVPLALRCREEPD